MISRCSHPPLSYAYIVVAGGVRVACGECGEGLYSLIRGQQVFGGDSGPQVSGTRRRSDRKPGSAVRPRERLSTT